MFPSTLVINFLLTTTLVIAMTHRLFLFSALNLTDPFDTQKESMNLLVTSFLHFHQSIL